MYCIQGKIFEARPRWLVFPEKAGQWACFGGTHGVACLARTARAYLDLWRDTSTDCAAANRSGPPQKRPCQAFQRPTWHRNIRRPHSPNDGPATASRLTERPHSPLHVPRRRRLVAATLAKGSRCRHMRQAQCLPRGANVGAGSVAFPHVPQLKAASFNLLHPLQGGTSHGAC
ncbi:hypothetical protein ACLOJK_000029 [Asimina triloba]